MSLGWALTSVMLNVEVGAPVGRLLGDLDGDAVVGAWEGESVVGC